MIFKRPETVRTKADSARFLDEAVEAEKARRPAVATPQKSNDATPKLDLNVVFSKMLMAALLDNTAGSGKQRRK